MPIRTAISAANDFLKNIRNPPSLDIQAPSGPPVEAEFSGELRDWRVSLSVPSNLPAFNDSEILRPLREATGNKMIFPYTPNIFMTHTANYSRLAPVHSNYPFPIYENSQVDQFIIQGEFTAENVEEARYWLAAVHFFRSVTKMAYGESENQGSPPPVLKLNGYGDFVFKDLPVIIESFQLNMPSDVDYIQVPDVGQGIGSWAPVRSEMSVGVFPTFSRDRVNKFSLDKFVRGEYVTGKSTGGFI